MPKRLGMVARREIMNAEDEIRRANALLAKKSWNAALAAFSRALDIDPRHFDAHFGIGALFLTRGRPRESLPCLISAALQDSSSAKAGLALADALNRIGQPARAAGVLAGAIKANPSDEMLQSVARKITAQGGPRPTAQSFLNQSAPANLAQAIAQILALVDRGQINDAYKQLSTLIFVAPNDPRIWKLLARTALHGATGEFAEMSARRAIAIDPSDADAWLLLYAIVRASGPPDEVIEHILRQSLRHCGPTPDIAAALAEFLFAQHRREDGFRLLDDVEEKLTAPAPKLMALRATALARAGDVAAAEKTFQSAFTVDPKNANTIAAATAFYDKQADPSPMLSVLTRAKAAGAAIGDGEIFDAEARISLRTGDVEKARTLVLRAIERPSNQNQLISRYFTLGRIEDRRGDFHSAFEAITMANSLMEEVWEKNGPCDHGVAIRRLASLHQRLQTEIDAGAVAVPERSAGPRNIAFLVGFPRSGTTLLDTILRAHSRVEVFEEEKIFINALRQAAPGIAGDETNYTEDWLNVIHQTDPASLRKNYLDGLSRIAEEELRDDKIYVDKLPLNMNWAPLIHKIFPQAVFILALRHPLDVAISNLAQDFGPNNAMMNMTRLARINHFYDASFSLWRDFENWRRPIVEKVAYEDIVGDLENTASKVMARLGLDWEADQARFFETAAKRGFMKTPSYTQVTRKLYSTSKARWKNYAFALEGDDTAALRQWARRRG